jgi:ABC-type sugar transport system substrate-binding protein
MQEVTDHRSVSELRKQGFVDTWPKSPPNITSSPTHQFTRGTASRTFAVILTSNPQSTPLLHGYETSIGVLQLSKNQSHR